jgi:hypothetical protein
MSALKLKIVGWWLCTILHGYCGQLKCQMRVPLVLADAGDDAGVHHALGLADDAKQATANIQRLL